MRKRVGVMPEPLSGWTQGKHDEDEVGRVEVEEKAQPNPANADQEQAEDHDEVENQVISDSEQQENLEEEGVKDQRHSDPEYVDHLDDHHAASSAEQVEPEQDQVDSTDSDSNDSDMEVTDLNTYCTLYRNGNYIAHREEALLPGVVERVGVRYKLEWRQTYASVWVRKPDWVRFPKPDYPESSNRKDPRNSTALVIKPPSIKRKIRDWLSNKENKRKKIEKAERRKRSTKVVMVADKGVQTDWEENIEEVKELVDVGVQLALQLGLEEIQAGKLQREQSQSCEKIFPAEENETPQEDPHIPLIRQESSEAEVPAMVAQGRSASINDVVHLGGMDEVENIDNSDVPYRDGRGNASDEEVLKEAKGIIIMGWEDTEGTEGLVGGEGEQQPVETAASTSYETAQFDSSLRGLIDKIMENFDDLDADQKTIQVQALKFIIEHVGNPSEETTRLLQFMTHLIQKTLHGKAKSLDDDEETFDPVNSPALSETAKRGSLNILDLVTKTVEGFEELDEELRLIRCQAMKFILENVNILNEEFVSLLHKLIARVRDEAHRKFIRLYGIGSGDHLQRTDSPDDAICTGTLRNDVDIRAKKKEFCRLVEEWEVAVKEKKDSLKAEMEKWDDVMDRLARDAEEMKITEEHIGKPPSCTAETISQPAIVPVYELPGGLLSLNLYERLKCILRVPSGPDGQPLGAPRSPGPDSRLNNIITLIYEKMEDPVNRPRALGQHVLNSIMQDLRDIRNESNQAARRNKCTVLRYHIIQLDGVVDFFDGLHEQLLCRAEEEARRAQEANEDPLPFFSFGPAHGSQDTSFDDTSPEEEGEDEYWSDEGYTLFEHRSSDDHGSSSE
ncbi:hypothetical protein MLD38_023429 [Melastoma candidum]|uniref:Uncharacterized protein n=1 Tax=Melastoma candidum TaxID=119954 RepID=A0ACB9NS20_9MYRT|nr:hypothetical protein MLD38_023429 [Melastoma candidum]